MFGKRSQPWDPATGRRPSDDQLMELLRVKLVEIAPSIAAGSRVDHGVLVGRNGWSLTALPNHTGRPGHFDIGFVPGSGSGFDSSSGSGSGSNSGPGSGSGGQVIADCISGTGPMETAVQQMLHIWAGTSGACFLAMVAPRANAPLRDGPPPATETEHSESEPQATHPDRSKAAAESPAVRRDGSDPAGVPGWHSIVSNVIGYGTDPANVEALQTALTERPVLRETAPTLNRARHNGIKVYLHKTPTSTTGEVRVNGVPDVAASQALAALPWPEVTVPTTARFYAVALHQV